MQPSVEVAGSILDSYIGTYTLVIDPKRKIIIERVKEGLIARMSAQSVFLLLFQSNTKFQFKNVLDANCEFKEKDGKISGFTVEQNGHFEWNKTE
jgi:hypothetical protein